MRFEFKLPDIGEGMVEGEIVQWHVKPGDSLKEDEPMLDVMTDKATVTISSPKAGKVLEIRGREGEIMKVGSVLIVLEVAESAVEAAPQARPDGGQKREESPGPVRPVQGEQKVLATPATRRLARELGVNLSQVAGTGRGGRVTHEDVRLSVSKEAPPPKEALRPGAAAEIRPLVSLPGAAEERIPFRGLRRKIAEKMSLSLHKASHFTYVDEADATELVALRDKADPMANARGIRLTFLPFIIRAVVQALKKHPFLNSTLDEEKQEIVLKRYYHIGIGAATPEGLTVPVVKHADQKSLWDLAKAVNDLGDRAKTGKLTLEELQGSTFTITSLGPLGGMFATPIINYPEVAILGIHKIHKRPVARDHQIVVRDMMYVSLSFDHRVIDGDVGARFAAEVIEYLQNPGLLLLE